MLTRSSFKGKLTWWMDHFVDAPFRDWRRLIHLSRRGSIVDFAQHCVDNGVMGFGRGNEYARDVAFLAAEIVDWMGGGPPDLYRVRLICAAWEVPMEEWLLNPQRMASDV